MGTFREILRYVTWPVRMLARIPASLISSPRRFLGFSLPTRVAFVVGSVLFFLVVIYFAYKAKFGGNPNLSEVLWPAFPIALVLVVAISVAVHQIVRTWLKPVHSTFPDIDRAWQQILRTLEKQNVPIQDVPVFLVLGCPSREEADQLFRAAKLKPTITTPAGDHPLVAYWIDSALYLVLTRTSASSQLAAKLRQLDDQSAHEVDLVRQAIAGSTMHERDLDPVSQQRHMTMLAAADQLAARDEAEPPAEEAKEDLPSDARDTMVVDRNADEKALGSGTLRLSQAAFQDAKQKLRYVCELLVQARQPVCSCNGILALLPFEIIRRGDQDTLELQKAVTGDMNVLRESLLVRCQTIAAVTGMQGEPGFCELLERVGRKRASSYRFGHGFRLWNPPIDEQVSAVVAHACKTFEDWTYLLFGEKQGLARKGNKRLYSLLCCIRSVVYQRLERLMVEAFADHADDRKGGGDALLFSGVYFMATGESEEEQGFVGSVVRKLTEDGNEGELAWTEKAVQTDERYHSATQLTLFVDGFLLLAVVALALGLLLR